MATEDVRFLLVHHTASAIGAEPIGVMRGAYNFHTGPEKGWSDVAYNFFIDQNGVVYEGRAGSLDRAVAADATGGNQGFAQLVCLLGDFTSEMPADATLASLNLTLAWLADRFGVDTTPGAQVTFTSRGSNRYAAGTTVVADTVSGHREMSQTACPGDTFFPFLDAFVQTQVDDLRRGTPPLAPATGSLPPGSLPTPTLVPPTTSPAATATTVQPIEPATTTSTVAPTSTATTVPASTVPATVASGPLGTAPDPSGSLTNPSGGDDLDAGPPQGTLAVGSATAPLPGRDTETSNTLTWAIAAGALVAAGGAAVYIGAKGRHDDAPVARPDAPAAPTDALPPPSAPPPH